MWWAYLLADLVAAGLSWVVASVVYKRDRDKTQEEKRQ